jgi:hypothetical protein
MPKTTNGRQRADDQLLMALACGATIQAAAKQSGLAERTIYKRLKQPDFQLRLRDVQTDILKRTTGALTAAATESVRTLLELQKPGVPPSTRLGAARAVLELGIKMREIVELEVRLVELEQRVELEMAPGQPMLHG